jgi:hypothetical protein
MKFDFRTLFQSKKVNRTLKIVGIVIITLVIFQAGMFVGFKKASFAYRFGDNYARTFGGHRDEMSKNFPNIDFPNSHGTIGKIIKINLPTIIIKGKDNLEKIVVIKNNTDIRLFREAASTTDLKIDSNVMVLGTPNEKGEIEARLIRLMPMDTDRNMTNTTSSRK